MVNQYSDNQQKSLSVDKNKDVYLTPKFNFQTKTNIKTGVPKTV